MSSPNKEFYFEWVDGLKAFAILAILLNHFVETFGPPAWFTNPSEDWPDFASRLQQFFPSTGYLGVDVVYFLGWLGDSGPGIFLLLSGFGLALSASKRSARGPLDAWAFYGKRLLRIFPLYIIIHLATLLGSALAPGYEHSIAGPEVLFSLLGLRFTDSLFFFVNPSWWFIWTILQLYILFPFLYMLMRRIGISQFLVVTLVFTILSRGAGLLGIRYSESLYYWMTGIFFGSRLAEFTFGMAFGYLMFHHREKVMAYLKVPKALAWSMAIYVTGLSASIVWAGTLVSNLLVTVGMSGLFYGLWERLIKQRLKFLVSPLLWIGASSYGLYLLHQAPLIWTRSFFDGASHVLAAVFVLLVSFPLARLMENFTYSLLRRYARLQVSQALFILSTVIAFFLLTSWKLIKFSEFPGWQQQIIYFLFASLMIFLILMEQKQPDESRYFWRLLILTAFFTSLFNLFLLPANFYLFSILMGAMAALLIILLRQMASNRGEAWAAGLGLAAVLVIFSEAALTRISPLETQTKWGEFPALEIHPTRIYALKPNLDIRLRYNNYDYRLKTNSFGLASPPFTKERPDPDIYRIMIIGDAFSMPEGMEYEAAFPALLQEHFRRWQKPHPLVEVINAGVTGYGPNEQSAQLDELLPVFQPNLVIYQFFINEFLDIQLTPEERLQDIGLRSDLSALEEVIRGSQLLNKYARVQRKLRESLTGNIDNDYRYGRSLLAFYEKNNPLFYNQAVLKKMRTTLEIMHKNCAERGAQMLIFFVPGQVEVSAPDEISYFPTDIDLSDTSRFDMQQPLKYAQRCAEELDITLIDLTPFLKTHPTQPVYFSRSWHWNQEGHQVVAQVVFEKIKFGIL